MALIHVFKDFLNSTMKIIIIGLTMASLIPFLFFVGSQIDATAPEELQTNKSLDSINDYYQYRVKEIEDDKEHIKPGRETPVSG